MGSGSSKSQTQQQSQQSQQQSHQVKSEKIETVENTPLIATATASFLRPMNVLSGRHLTETEVKRATAIGKNRGI
jgi:hypothetical protein